MVFLKFFMRKLYLWVCLIAPLMSLTCFEEPDFTVLPPITQTGENTFGCLVNGDVWVADFGTDVIHKGITTSARSHSFSIGASASDGQDTLIFSMSFSLKLSHPIKADTTYYFYAETFEESYGTYRNFVLGGGGTPSGCSLTSDSVSSGGWIRFSKYDFEERIAAGEFQVNGFHAIKKERSYCLPYIENPPQVTQGRFDVQL